MFLISKELKYSYWLAKETKSIFIFIQTVFGQDLAALEQDLQDLINQHNDEVQQYVDPLISRIRAYSASFGDEHLRVQQDYSNLRQTLQDSQDQLSDGSPDDYTCFSSAISDAFDIFRERCKYRSAVSVSKFSTQDRNYLETS